MLTFSQLWKEIKDPIISMIPGILALLEINSSVIFIISGLTGVISQIIEYIYERIFCKNLDTEYSSSIEIHKYNEKKNLNQIYRVVNWYIIKGICDNSIKVHRLLCNESTIKDDDYIVRDEAIFHADYTIVPDEDYYVDIYWKDNKFQANHYIIGTKNDNPVYKIYGHSIEKLKEFEEYCLAEHREYSKNIGKEVYKYYEWDTDEYEWCKHDIETIKTFDNIFIPRHTKNSLKNKIDTFINSKDNYKKWGIPYKLGLVLHGYPGCGKTSTIYAIANYLNRCIYLVKLDTFRNNSELYRAARNIPKDAIVVIEDIDAHRVVHNRNPDRNDEINSSYTDSANDDVSVNLSVSSLSRLSSVSEFDDMQSINEENVDREQGPDEDEDQDQVQDQDQNKEQKQDNETVENEKDGVKDGVVKDVEKQTDVEKENVKQKALSKMYQILNKKEGSLSEAELKKYNKLLDDVCPQRLTSNKTVSGKFFKNLPKDGKTKTIDSLLEIFDGYNYLPGAIVIITTNHIDAIDPAIIRPGRMDHKFFFDYALPETVNDILNFFYSNDNTNNDIDYLKLEEILSEFPDNDQRIIEYNKLTTAEIINSIILPNINNKERAIKIIKDKMFYN